MGLDMFLSKAKGQCDHETYAEVRHLLNDSRWEIRNQVKEELSQAGDWTDEDLHEKPSLFVTKKSVKFLQLMG